MGALREPNLKNETMGVVVIDRAIMCLKSF